MSGFSGTKQIASPTGLEAIIVAGASAIDSTVTLAQVRDSAGYAKVIPTTGQTYTIPNNLSVLQATPAGALSAWTVNTPLAPFDGQRIQIFTTQTITTFNFVGSGTQTVNGNLAGSFSANTSVEYVYSLSNTSWDRIQ